ncbi:MAG: hypothetical protein M3405_13795 [Acidobacteriota bacterium]|nr:hypothetical protein [Acidobacteriota bacterium]
MKYLKILFFLLIFGVGTQNLFACMCGATSVCQAYADASSVIVAKVKSFESAKVPLEMSLAEGEKSDVIEDGQEVLLEIETTFKGKKHKLLKILQPNSGCDWTFTYSHLEKKYLFYLNYNKKHKRYSIIPCGRNNPINRASNDLSWLNGLPESLKRTRLSGLIQVNDDTDTFPTFPDFEVDIKGKNKTYSVISDKNGLYKVWDLPIGKYIVLPKLPNLYQLAWTTSTPDNGFYTWNPEREMEALEVTIKKENCGGVDFMIEKKKDEK